MRFLVITLMALFLSTSRTTLAADPLVLEFDIRRHNESIGHHRLTFAQKSGGVEVSTDILVKVTVFGFTAYRFDQKGTELWESGRLRRLVMDANDNGERYKVLAETTPTGRLRVIVNGESQEYDQMPPATLWHPVPKQATQVLDPADGRPTRVSVSEIGAETITVRSKQVQTIRWRWDGEIKRDLWFDKSGNLAQAYIQGDDGSDIYYILK